MYFILFMANYKIRFYSGIFNFTNNLFSREGLLGKPDAKGHA